MADAYEYLESTPVSSLPSVGWKSMRVMRQCGIHTAGHLRLRSLRELQRLFGQAKGKMLVSGVR